MKNKVVGLKVGILGGGQLARMLAQSAQQLGAQVHVLSARADDPAAQVTGFHQRGSPDKSADLKKFLARVDALTFESEFFDMDQVRAAAPKGLMIFPDPQIMRELQDRRTQKAWLTQFKIPTAPFVIVEAPVGLIEAHRQFPRGFVVKKARGGYDGNGTFYVRKRPDMDRLAADFPGPAIAEDLIRFRRELATIAVCGARDFVFLPLVESCQTHSRCDWVQGPVKHPRWAAMQVLLRRFLKKIGYRGVIAFEFFDTGTELLVNEIAPRVHNSGHYSMQALTKSQFELHWLAGLSQRFVAPLPCSQAFVMTNLLGESEQDFVFPDPLQGQLHWYGKTGNRPGRKMGHLNYQGAKGPALLRLALTERKRIRK